MAGLSSGNRGTVPAVDVTTDQKEIDLVTADSPVSKASLLTKLGYTTTGKLHKVEFAFRTDDGVNFATLKRGATGTAYAYAAPNGIAEHGGVQTGTKIEECDVFTLTIPAGATVTAYATVGLTGVVASAN